MTKLEKKRATVFRLRIKGRVTLLKKKKKDMFTFNFGYQEFILFNLKFFCQWCQVM